MKKSPVLIACLALFLSSATKAQVAPSPGQVKAPVWADLGDIAHYRPDLMPDASIILRSLTTQNSKYAPNKESFVANIELQEYPYQSTNGGLEYRNVTALMRAANGSLFFRRFSFTVSGQPRDVENIKILQDIPLSRMNFTVNTGLIQRLVVLDDAQDGVTLLYPLGVGGFDPGVLFPGRHSILTPLFQNAVLKRSTVTAHRSDPSYYRNQAFMPITNARGLTTAIAFHITILSDQDWSVKGPNYLVRGFDSHGCMRLRLKDLTEFFTIVMNGASDHLPVNVSYFVDFLETAHGLVFLGSKNDTSGAPLNEVDPYPIFTDYYHQVQNMAAPGQEPQAGRDEEGLVILETLAGTPRLDDLTGIDGDEIQDIKFFDGLTEDLPPTQN